MRDMAYQSQAVRQERFLNVRVKHTRHDAPRRALRLACDVLIAWQRRRKGVRRPSSNAA